VRYSKELQSITSRFGSGPAPKDQTMDYLTRKSRQTAEQHADGIIDNLEEEG
jgi:hypothetical protein